MSEEDTPQPPPDALIKPTSSADAVEQKLEEVLKDIPEPKRELIRESMHEFFMAVVQRSAVPSIDSETAKILAASADKEHEYRFKFRTQVQKDEAEESLREHQFAQQKHKDRVKLFIPILITVLVVIVGCLTAGIYLAATGSEMLGTGILTATSFAVAGYLAGVGTSGFFKSE